jgi:hypothetical protein
MPRLPAGRVPNAQSRRAFLHDCAGLLQGHDARRELPQALEALVDGGLADTEVPGGVGLRMTLVEVLAEIGVGHFRVGHMRTLVWATIFGLGALSLMALTEARLDRGEPLPPPPPMLIYYVHQK